MMLYEYEKWQEEDAGGRPLATVLAPPIPFWHPHLTVTKFWQELLQRA